MSIAFVAIFLIILGAIPAIAVVTGVIFIVTAKSDDPSIGARHRTRILYGSATLVGATFALIAAYVFPTVYVSSTEVPGLLAALAPSLAGIVFVVIAAVGEALWPKPRGEQRGAYLTRRPALANAAALPKWACVTWGALLTGFLVFSGIAATHDGESPGRSLAHVVTDPNVSGASGPFPGWPYGGPMLVFAALLTFATLAVLHVIARRPAVSGTTPESDAVLRRISATNLVKGTQLSLAGSLAGVLLIGGNAAATGGWWWGVPALISAPVVLVGAIVALAWRAK